jgi:hypothetical protein
MEPPGVGLVKACVQTSVSLVVWRQRCERDLTEVAPRHKRVCASLVSASKSIKAPIENSHTDLNVAKGNFTVPEIK